MPDAEPIPYAEVSTNQDMRWVVKSVGMLVLSIIGAELLVLPYVWFSGPGSRVQFRQWNTLVSLTGVTAAAVAGVGIVQQRRIAIPVLGALLLALPASALMYIPLSQAWSFLPGQALSSLAYCAMLGALWRRAERRAVLIPPKPLAAMPPPATDDIIWLVRLAGWYTLVPLLAFVGNLVGRALASYPAIPLRLGSFELLSLAMAFVRIPIAAMLIRGRAGALPWLIALYLAGPLLTQLVVVAQTGVWSVSWGSFLVFRVPEPAIVSILALMLYGRATRR